MPCGRLHVAHKQLSILDGGKLAKLQRGRSQQLAKPGTTAGASDQCSLGAHAAIAEFSVMMLPLLQVAMDALLVEAWTKATPNNTPFCNVESSEACPNVLIGLSRMHFERRH